MNWIEVHIDTRPDRLDDLCARLEAAGVTGLVIDDEADFKDFLENNYQYWDYVDDELLREKINPPAPDKAEVVHGTRRFRCGDKVMQIKNCDEISNGDIGYITKICKAGDETNITIDFGDGRMAEYDTSQLDMLDLGYASTIHKSQGSEYRSVIINLQCAHYVMLTRPLVYTAITRGKENVIIVGERRALCMAIKKTDTEKRGTCLAKRLQAAMQ